MLPDSSNGSSEVETLINAIDLLSHRTGIAGGESLYFHAQPLLDDTSHVAAYAGLPQVGPFRSTMQYKNLGYGLVSQAMTQVTGKSYSDLLERYITQPLSLEWTGVGYDRRQLLNTANKYLVADDGSVIENPRPLYHEGTHALASGGIWSSVNDLLTFYQEVLKAAAQEGTKIKARQSPLKQLSTILKGHAFLSS
ncbi:hypothetical protein EIK77_001092 [Talaromyces pinophilus]|nr:hypothetical protein EIK77_001092 [Talaromyces pinophilus]